MLPEFGAEYVDVFVGESVFDHDIVADGFGAQALIHDRRHVPGEKGGGLTSMDPAARSRKADPEAGLHASVTLDHDRTLSQDLLAGRLDFDRPTLAASPAPCCLQRGVVEAASKQAGYAHTPRGSR